MWQLYNGLRVSYEFRAGRNGKLAAEELSTAD